MATNQATVTIEVRGARAIERALRVLGETGAPFLREALEDSGRDLQHAAARRAHPSIGATVSYVGIRGSGARLSARVKATHAGAKSMEFGRKYYYRGFTGRRQKATGTRFQASPGQRARPFVGIVTGGQAVAETHPRAKERILDAIEREWDRIAGGPD